MPAASFLDNSVRFTLSYDIKLVKTPLDGYDQSARLQDFANYFLDFEDFDDVFESNKLDGKNGTFRNFRPYKEA